MQSNYQESYAAGVQYGKNYRRTYRTWSSDTGVARRATDAIMGAYDYSGFFNGVIKGLQPLCSQDFDRVFKQNEQSASYKAQALLNGARLQVATQDATHYDATLEHWQKIGALLVVAS